MLRSTQSPGSLAGLCARQKWGPEPGKCPNHPRGNWTKVSGKRPTATTLPALRAMIFHVRRLTPGYFRLLQMQLASGHGSKPQDRAMNQLALLLAVMGLSLSYYSIRQMSEEVKPDPEP